MKNFVLIGAGGYVAPRHMKAIRDTGNNLVAALDKHDSVGVLDNYFPEADFFTEFERFERHIENLKRKGTRIDYVSVCSPNHFHDAHVRFGLKIDADVICEKPLVLNPWNADALETAEKETGRKVYTLLQVRYHPAILALREKVKNQRARKYKITLNYITPRGHWYHASWKGDIHKSGGIATNIGIHFFDLLLWIFGPVQENHVSLHTAQEASGKLVLEQADVDWFLSIDPSRLPSAAREQGRKAWRSMLVDGEEIAFDEGWENLHTDCYRGILEGNGFGIGATKASISLVHAIRNFQSNK